MIIHEGQDWLVEETYMAINIYDRILWYLVVKVQYLDNDSFWTFILSSQLDELYSSEATT